eukprot:scaffold235544_cov28-Attheya_sp.AAC.1
MAKSIIFPQDDILETPPIFDQEDILSKEDIYADPIIHYMDDFIQDVPVLSAPLLCNCAEIKDMCSALLASGLLVRATIHSETKVGNNNRYDDIQYTAIVKTVFMNAQTNVAEGQTIEIRAGDICGVPFATGDDMILGLSPPSSNGDYFSTHGCGLDSPIDSNGVIRWTEMGNCFTYKLRLKGQSYDAAPGPPAVGPRNVPQITPTLTKEERQEAKEAKKAARQAKKAKKKAEKKALKKAQRKDVTIIWEACPRFKPNKKNQCNLPDSVICPYGKKRQCICKGGYFKCNKTLAK